jgi:cytochrome oxidase Cu insertion factor (SCO1/SenC/PrrC family)
METHPPTPALGDPAQGGDRGSSLAFYLVVLWLAATSLWWFAALVDLPPTTPDWVVRARAICFGNGENGLPDRSGWLLLTVSPLSFLAVVFAVWGAELWADLLQRWRDARGRLVLLILVALLAWGGIWAGLRVADGLARGQAWRVSDSEPFPEYYPRLNQTAPAFELTDQRGGRVSLRDLRGELVFLTFAFAHCNTVCPVTVANVLAGARELEAPHRVAIVTLDPWRDTARSLPAIAAQWGLGERDLALSDSVERVGAVLDSYNILRQRDLNTGDVTHPPLVYVIDREGRIAYALNGPSKGWVREAGRRAAEPPSPAGG